MQLRPFNPTDESGGKTGESGNPSTNAVSDPSLFIYNHNAQLIDFLVYVDDLVVTAVILLPLLDSLQLYQQNSQSKISAHYITSLVLKCFPPPQVCFSHSTNIFVIS